MNIKKKKKQLENSFQKLTEEIGDLKKQIQEKEVKRIEIRGQYALLEEMEKEK